MIEWFRTPQSAIRNPKSILLAIGLAVVVALGGVAWRLWSQPPPPPPSTAEEVYADVMDADPGKLPDADREEWLRKAGSAFDRMPPHEFDKLVRKTISDPAWHERMSSLPPEQRRKMMDLVSQEKQLQMLLQVVEALKSTPAPLRKVLLEQGRKRMQSRGEFPNLSKQQMAERIGSTTPTQRARFVRAMRDLRKMAEEAGIKD